MPLADGEQLKGTTALNAGRRVASWPTHWAATVSTCWSWASESPAPASRWTQPREGLSVVAVDAHDLAFGTSRWSSKLVHGGLRYLAKAQVGVAHESAVERHILMTRTAPHLSHALPMVVPLTSSVTRGQALSTYAGLVGGGRAQARGEDPATGAAPAPAAFAPRDAALVPGLRPTGCAEGCSPGTASSRTTRGWWWRWRGRRPAAGARVLTRARVTSLDR